MAIHLDLQTTGNNSRDEIYCHSPIPRRLAEQTVVQAEVYPGQTENTPPVPTNGLSLNWDKTEIEPHSTAGLCGSSPQPPRGHSATRKRVNGLTHDQSLSLPPQPIHSSTTMGEFTGTPEQTGHIRPMGENQHLSHSTEPPPVIQSPKESPQPSNPSVEEHHRNNPVVNGQRKLQGMSNPPTHLPVQELFRCFYGGMGCPCGPMQNQWVMIQA